MSFVADYFKREKKKLVKYISKRLNKLSALEPEDILQDVFAKIISCKYDEEQINLDGLVFKSLKNRIIDIYRRPRREISADQPIGDDGANLIDMLTDKEDSLETKVTRKELWNEIFDAVNKLPEDQKTAWIATEVEHKSIAEVAEILKIPDGTVLSRKHRANQRLKMILNKNNI